MNFKPIYYTEEEKGKKIPSSKRRYFWLFQINGQSHQLELFCSFISNKRVVVLDNIRVHESRNFSFEWKYELEGHKLQIVQQVAIFPLLVNNLDFIVMLQQLAFERNNMFGKNQNQYSEMNGGVHTQLELESNSNTISNINMSDFESMSERVKKWTSYKSKVSNAQQSFDIPFSGQDPYKDMILLLDEDSDEQLPPFLKQSAQQRAVQLI